MKNYLTLVLALAVVSSPAFASRARLESLGEGKNGSYYIQDSRNMFLNPATIVHYKKKLMLELGQAQATGAEASNDSRAQGGFINTFGDFTYALYLNNVSDTAAALTAVTGIQPDSAIELQFAGEGSMNWGLSVTTAGNNNGTKSASYWGARAGIEKGDLSVFGTVGITSDNKGTFPGSAFASEVKGKLKLDLAATYKMNDMTVFGKFNSTSNDVTVATSTSEVSSSSYGAGLGWNKEMTKSTHMFTRVEADYSQGKTAGVVDNKAYNVPVVMGAEAQALSWLAIRGSIGHSLIGQDVTGRKDLTGLTTVAAGLGLTFGDVSIDGLVASNGVTPSEGLGMGTAPTASQNLGFGDNMVTRVAMTYNF